MAPQKTTDGLKILHARYIDGNPAAMTDLIEARERLRISIKLRELRDMAGLTQMEVAQRAGTSRSVIARLEKAGYEKHTVSTLHRVAQALGYSVKVDFVPNETGTPNPDAAMEKANSPKTNPRVASTKTE